MLSRGVGGRAKIRTIVEFWRGGLPLGRAFWLWGLLGGGIVSLLTTLLALMLLAVGGPAWLAVLVFAAHIPWNFVLLVGIWRSAGRPEVGHAAANFVRLTILLWVVVLSLLQLSRLKSEQHHFRFRRRTKAAQAGQHGLEPSSRGCDQW